MNAIAIAQIINAALSVISALRRFVGSNEELARRLDEVDAGGEAITIAEVQIKLDDWQSAIDDGRQLD